VFSSVILNLLCVCLVQRVKMKEFKLVLLYEIYSFSFVQVLSRKPLLLSKCMLENLSLKDVNIDAILKPFSLTHFM